jgi:hypothetical protein
MLRRSRSRVVDRRLVNASKLFLTDVVKAWIDPRQKNPMIIHHYGSSRFVADGRAFTLKSRMR